ncbi:TPA: hypothetical protein QHU55_002558 [Klebsiella aerogenes]|nr:hypothetical protein [Klebsiella aerogenes]
MTKCALSDCFAPDLACSLGETMLCRCKHWNTNVDDNFETVLNVDNEFHLPWTGLAMGLTDVGFISGCKKPKIVGVLGAENAGKTSLLAAFYLLVSRGMASKMQRRFAGSYTLEGWEAVSTALRWEPGFSPSFPAHTPSGSRRSPGLLHLAFQDTKSRLIEDYLFADAPGEWFGKWALNSDSPDAEGARWLSNNADIFLLIVDREALSGEKKGLARSELRRLIQRLAGERGKRPVAVVWTKGDMPEDVAMENSVRQHIISALQEITEFKVQVLKNENPNSMSENSLLLLLNWVLEQLPMKGELPVIERNISDPFFMFKQS